VEILFPIQDARLIGQVRNQILACYLADNMRARLMLPDGTYIRLAPENGAAPLDSQARLLARPVSEMVSKMVR
jgi:polyphosphate kinase